MESVAGEDRGEGVESVGGEGVESAVAPPPPPLTAILANGVPTSTVVSTGTRISASTPLAGDGTSVSILSVEMSQMVSSACTRSPTSNRQAMTVPSATDTPIWGIVTSTSVAVSVREELTACLPDAIGARQHGLLKRG